MVAETNTHKKNMSQIDILEQEWKWMLETPPTQNDLWRFLSTANTFDIQSPYPPSL